MFLKVFNKKEFDILELYTKEWVRKVLGQFLNMKISSLPLEYYHKWQKELLIDHENVFCAENRYICPGKKIQKILLNEKVKDFLERIDKRGILF